ncbi:hypothetical protein F5Y09DRAFT_331822 [Xylaria sp. FL1042]|nr:hypothetical protein F5Y09DRAFT_331822 [Xylaria sp. FL1042]
MRSSTSTDAATTTTTATTIIHANKDDADDSYSVSSCTESSELMSQFSRFGDLPPELRHQIWRFAVPSPGINFFNVHCFPNDHEGCNRSTSPPWAYLDLRRLDIEDDDDDVFCYDPSSWQARCAVRQSCREARLICTIPDAQAATITLTRPKRGLFVRAGDGQLRKTPLHVQDDNVGESLTEPVVRRTVQVHVNDILVLSVENCSFNLPHEEAPFFPSDDDDVDGLATGDADEGWAYDPQLTPELPRVIPASRLCAGMARCSPAPLRSIADALLGLLYSHIPEYFQLHPRERWSGPLLFGHFLLMFDSLTQAVGDRELEELTSSPEAVWDRFGDCYVRLPWRTGDFNPPQGFPITYRITKVWPETNDMRVRYLRSALLHSPKRPARSS